MIEDDDLIASFKDGKFSMWKDKGSWAKEWEIGLGQLATEYPEAFMRMMAREIAAYRKERTARLRAATARPMF